MSTILKSRPEIMERKASLFKNGNSQAVRIPEDFRFEGKQVYIRRDQNTGDVILSEHPHDWSAMLQALDAWQPEVSEQFFEGMADRDTTPPEEKDLFGDN